MDYKFSANSKEIITSFILANFDYEWNGSYGPQMLNRNDALVYLGRLPNETIAETGEVVSWFDGLHFDIQTAQELKIPAGITQHFPTKPKHTFA